MATNDFWGRFNQSFVVIFFIWEEVDLKRTRIKLVNDYDDMGINVHNTKSPEELFNEFNLHCKARNLSSATLEYYYFCWKPFKHFIDKESIQLADISVADINSYIMFLREDNTKNDISVSTRVRGIRTILYYFMKQRYINRFEILVPKADKVIKETYTDYELQILLKKPSKDADFTEYRNWVITNFLLATGVRSRTVVNIKNKDVDLDNQFVKLTTTKSKKQQIIPLSHTLCIIIREFMMYRKGQADDYLFCTWWGGQLLPTGLNQAIRGYNLSRGVTKTSIHLYRHTFAKKWILNGGDVFTLQKMLGHSTLEMVRNYVNIYQQDMYNNFNQFNPLESTHGYKSKITK